MKNNTGKSLEEFVASIERFFVSRGTRVEVNKKVYMDGVQVAEYDVVVTARIGSGEARWLIECRDRPSQGAAGVEWINQLPSRRALGKFHKVTAVSTTGFSAAATIVAEQFDVELRTVGEIESHELASWLQVPFIPFRVDNSQIVDFHLTVEHADGDPTEALLEIKEIGTQNIVIFNEVTGSNVLLPDYLDRLCDALGLYEQCIVGGNQTVSFCVDVRRDRLTVHSKSMSLSVAFLEFKVIVESQEISLAFSTAEEYRTVGGAAPLAQVVTFQPADMTVGDVNISLQNFKITRVVGIGNADQEGSPP